MYFAHLNLNTICESFTRNSVLESCLVPTGIQTQTSRFRIFRNLNTISTVSFILVRCIRRKHAIKYKRTYYKLEKWKRRRHVNFFWCFVGVPLARRGGLLVEKRRCFMSVLKPVWSVWAKKKSKTDSEKIQKRVISKRSK